MNYKETIEKNQQAIDQMREQLKHESRSFGAIRALNVLRVSAEQAGLMTSELAALITVIGGEADNVKFFQDDHTFMILPYKRAAYKCPRCNWCGSETELKPITNDEGEVGIDYADGSPIMGCPNCGEHKLIERA